MNTAEIIPLDDLTMREVAELAVRAGAVIVERGGQTRFCGADNIPHGWHRVGVGMKESA